jgi:hypothetical protein
MPDGPIRVWAGSGRHFPERRESFHGGFVEDIHVFHDPENACPIRPYTQ